MTLTITISTNASVLDKQHLASNWNNSFLPQRLTPAQIREVIQVGHAIAATFQNNTRKRAGFLSTGFVGLDFDGGYPLAAALRDPFIQDYAFLVYTTASHRNDGKTDRFRVLWALPQDLTVYSQAETVVTSLLQRYPQADRACKDASRMYYGNRQAEFPLVQDVAMPQLVLDELLTPEPAKVLPGRQKTQAPSTAGSVTQQVPDAPQADEAEVRRALTHIPPRAPGSGNYQVCLTVLMALNTGFGADRAIELAEEWSPSQPGWDVAQKIRGFTSSEVTLGSLYWIAQQHGFVAKPQTHAVISVPAVTPTQIISKRFLPAITQSEKLVILKSYQGTGKTTAIRTLVESQKQAGKVLVIAHRRTLLRQISSAFGISNYEDVTASGKSLRQHTDSVAITFDSLYKLTPGHYRGALVILDEFTQGLRHLTGATCRVSRMQIIESLDYALAHASQIIASDADAGDLEINYLWERAGKPALFYLENTWTPSEKQVVMYSSKATLQAALFAAVSEQKPVVVACDSKALTQEFDRALRTRFSETTILTINSGNSQSEEVQAFIGNISTASQELCVLVYSPSLFTGVDLNIPHFEEVYLFANGKSQNHRDLWQAVNRVRDEKAVIRAWVTPVEEERETSADRIFNSYFDAQAEYQELMQLNGVTGEWTYDPKWNQYLRLTSGLTAFDNASHSELRRNFVATVLRLGLKLGFNNETGSPEAAVARADMKRAKAGIEKERVAGVLAASDIDDATAEQYRVAKDLSQTQKYELERYHYRMLNGNDTTDLELLSTIPLQRLVQRVVAFEAMENTSADLISTDTATWNDLLPDRETLALQSKLRRDIDQSFGGYRNQLVLSNLSDFIAFAAANKERIHRLLGVRVRDNLADQPMKLLNEHLRQIGFEAIEHQRKANANGKSARIYKIDDGSVKLMQNVLKRRRERRK